MTIEYFNIKPFIKNSELDWTDLDCRRDRLIKKVFSHLNLILDLGPENKDEELIRGWRDLASSHMRPRNPIQEKQFRHYKCGH
jgi:hypothetical protein